VSIKNPNPRAATIKITRKINIDYLPSLFGQEN
jgi:hypothetical protein